MVTASNLFPVLLKYLLLDVVCVVQRHLLLLLVQLDASLDIVKQQRVVVRQGRPPVEELVLGEHESDLLLLVECGYLLILRVCDLKVDRVPEAKLVQVLFDVCLGLLSATLAKVAFLRSVLTSSLRLVPHLLLEEHLNFMHLSIDLCMSRVPHLIRVLAFPVLDLLNLLLRDHCVDALRLAVALALDFLALLELG